MIKRKISILAIILACCTTLYAGQHITFPPDVGIINVKDEPYYAKGDGKSDDTEAIQKALDDNPNGNKIIYLPVGTYLVSRQLEWPRGKTSKEDYQRTILQGEIQDKSIIKLKNNCTGYDNSATPRAVINTGFGPETRFRNAIRNLTVNVGKKNPGAVGIRFNSSNQGVIRDVTVQSEDKKGAIGIDMGYTPNIGPLLLTNVSVIGFEVGIFTRFPQNGMTMEHISLKNQTKYGIENYDQSLTIRKLKYQGKVPAILNTGKNATLTLIDAKLESPRRKKKDGEAISIINDANIFIRNLIADGFKISVQNRSPNLDDVKLLSIREYSSDKPYNLCATPKKSLNLPIAETANPPWVSSRNWITISGDYGATGGDGTNDADAIQAAIDDGAEALLFEADGRYTINKDIHIRKNISRIIGAESRIDGTGKFIIEKGAPPTIIFERLGSLAGGIKHESGRTLVLKDLAISSYESSEMGAGDLFIENVSASSLKFNLQNVWARQLTLTSDKETKLINKSGIVWILGLTAYNTGTVIENIWKGELEILGAHIISKGGAQTTPMFINDNSNISLVNIRESATKNAFHTLIEETRDKEKLKLGEKSVKQQGKGSFIGLYSGYIPNTGINIPPTVNVGVDQFVILPNPASLDALVDDDGRGGNFCNVPGEWMKIKGAGKTKFENANNTQTTCDFSYSGEYDIAYAANDKVTQVEDTLHISVFDIAITPGDHSGDNVNSGRGADAYIISDNPKKNFGSTKDLKVSNNNKFSSKAYIKFDLSQTKGPITNVAFSFPMIETKTTKPRELNVFGLLEKKSYGDGKLSGNWKESALNWNNAPANINDISPYNSKENSGGGVNNSEAIYLGKIIDDGGKTQRNILRGTLIRNFFKDNKSKLATLIITSNDGEIVSVGSKENFNQKQPTLYLSYIDKNKSVDGIKLDGGYKVSDIQINPFTLETHFTLKISYRQNVQITLHKENGERIMRILNTQLGHGKDHLIKFNSGNLKTGKYLLRVKGEAFRFQKTFTVLN